MKRHAALGLAIILIFGISLTALASAGASGDPLISLSYITSKLIPDIKEQARSKTDAAFTPIYNNAVRRLDEAMLRPLINKDSIDNSFLNAVGGRLPASGANSFSPRTFRSNETVTAALGTSFFLRSGSAVISGGVLVNITQGVETGAGAALIPNNRYMAVSDGNTGIRTTSDNTTVDISGAYSIAPPYIPMYTDLADALKKMTLFRGGDTGYSLDRAANRLEALVMLIRLIGEEQDALAHTGSHPFTDVPDWGRAYAAYAYSKGYTNGVSADRFGTESPVLSSQYMTYILRALGYSDSAGDFTWDKSIEKCLELGMITASESDMLKSDVFYRDQVVYISYFALDCNLKGTTQPLLDRLVSSGVLTRATADEAISSVKTSRIK